MQEHTQELVVLFNNAKLLKGFQLKTRQFYKTMNSLLNENF